MRYDIAVIGINHKTASLETRESVSFSASGAEDFLHFLKNIYPLQEFVVLSTCNRVEVYAGSTEDSIDTNGFVAHLASYHNVSAENIIPSVYCHTGDEAVTHLFEVASGLDSLVIGETQILGQMKKSYQKALEAGSTGRVLNQAFQKAFAVGKKVRVLTRIGEGNVSISSVSCQLADEVLKGLSQRKVLLIGAGKVGALTLKSLRDKGADTILVSSRTYEKAKILAKEFNGKVVKFEEKEGFIARADIVISSTSAPHYVLHPDMIKRVVKKRNKRPVFLMDLAVPRDIDPEIGKIENVFLYNIDSLKRIAGQNIRIREYEINRCKKIIDEETNAFIKRIDLAFSRIKEDDKLLETVTA
ncbi:MAG: glutamyl-tRNA reductase [Candidatus Omnitrophota bacterium]